MHQILRMSFCNPTTINEKKKLNDFFPLLPDQSKPFTYYSSHLFLRLTIVLQRSFLVIHTSPPPPIIVQGSISPTCLFSTQSTAWSVSADCCFFVVNIVRKRRQGKFVMF